MTWSRRCPRMRQVTVVDLAAAPVPVAAASSGFARTIDQCSGAEDGVTQGLRCRTRQAGIRRKTFHPVPCMWQMTSATWELRISWRSSRGLKLRRRGLAVPLRSGMSTRCAANSLMLATYDLPCTDQRSL